MASYNWSITDTWTAFGPTGAAKLNIENPSGVDAEYQTGTTTPNASDIGGRLRMQDPVTPVDLKASERLYLRTKTTGATTRIFGQDAT